MSRQDGAVRPDGQRFLAQPEIEALRQAARRYRETTNTFARLCGEWKADAARLDRAHREREVAQRRFYALLAEFRGWSPESNL